MSTVSAQASDVGLIVQGTLIFLSAVVGILGFLVKGRLEMRQRIRENEMKHEQHLREVRLIRTREQLAVFVGPASMLVMQIWNAFWRVLPGVLDPMTNGKISAYWESVGFSFTTFMTGQIAELKSWVGPEVETTMSSKPDSPITKNYCRLMRRLVLKCGTPLVDLLKKHGGHLSQFPSAEKFKEQFPCSANDGWLRNSYYLQLMNWVDEFEEIFHEWDASDFSRMYPTHAAFPCQICPYILSQATELREKETALGAADHKVTNMDSDKKHVLKSQNEQQAKKTSKYVSHKEASS